MKTVLEKLKAVRCGECMSYKGMSVIPLLGSDEGQPNYATLDEAVREKIVTISEVSEGGTVPELKLVTKERNVFLLDGETLEGAKQNRTLNLSILAPANTTLIIPVSCVEQGRWSRRSETFNTASHNMMPSARSRRMEDVSDAMRSSGSRRSNQMKVWEDIEEKLERMKVSAPTQDMSAMFEAHSTHIDEYITAFTPLPDQVGAVFAIGRMIHSLEFFNYSRTFRDLFPKLLRSYGIEAIESEGDSEFNISPAEASNFIAQVVSAEATQHQAIGLGEDIRLSTENVTAAALVVDSKIIHLAAFQRHQAVVSVSGIQRM
jgi:hypothetical protein